MGKPVEWFKRVKILSIFLTFLLSLSVLPFTLVSNSHAAVGISPAVIDWETAVDYARVSEHVAQFSSHGSRVTGYPGYYAAKEYIKTEFRKYGERYQFGFELDVQEYNITVPLEYETRLRITSPSNLIREVKAYTAWPNDIQTCPTPPDGVIGSLIYVGEGNLEDFDGYDVEGSIVLMDFNTKANWLNAAKLGAKAVIFIEPEDTIYLQCMSKFLTTPVHFTRLYVSREDGELLKKANEVQIVSRMFYRAIRAENIIAKFTGADSRLVNDVIVISAHYDAWSPFPNMSYAAHEAIAPSILLELAKFFSEHPPSKTVWLVALSGHWEALAGAREFVEEYYFRPEVLNGDQRLWTMLSLWGIDSKGDGLQFLVSGHYNFYGAKPSDGTLNLRFAEIGNIIERFLREQDIVNPFRKVMQEEFGRQLFPWNFTEGTIHNYQYASTTLWYGTEAYPYMLDSEPATIAGCIGLGLSTRNTYRQYRGTPKNDFGEIDFRKIKPQFMVIAYLAYRLSTEENWQIRWADVAPTRIDMINPQRSWPGFITLKGKVVAFNVSSGWYKPMPGALVEVSIGLALPFQRVITIADENAKYEVHGIAPAATGGTAVEVMLTATGMLFEWFTYGWVINEFDGTIEYALDLGIQGAHQTSPIAAPLRHPEEVTTTITPCVPVTLFDVIDPRTIRPSRILDPRFSGYWQETTTRAGFFYFGVGAVGIIDFSSKSMFLVGYGAYYNGWDPVALVFTPPNTRFVLGVGVMGALWPTMVLTNSTEDYPEGTGMIADKPLTITFTAYRAAVDMIRLSKSRYSMMSSRFAGSASTEKKIQMAESHLAKVEDAISQKAWGEAYAESLTAWALAFRAYATEVMPLINDASTSALMIFALTILSAFFWERLLIHTEERARIFSMIVAGGTILGIFSFIHPAITLMSNSFMGLLGALIFIVFLIAILLLTRLGEQVRKTFELEILGIHRSELSWVDVVSTSVSVGLENMRKRRFRTVLTLMTIIVTTVALTSFTSVSYYTFEELVLGGEQGYRAPGYYDGILIKEGWGSPPTGALDPTLVQTIKSMVGDEGYVLPRAWYYPPSHPHRSPYVYENLSTPYGSEIIFSALGITVDEFNLTFRDATTGFGFSSKEIYQSCLLPTIAADHLYPAQRGEEPRPEMAIGKTIKAFGLNLTIAGIFDTTLLLPDLDTPSELRSSWDYGTPVDARFNNLLSPAGTLPLIQTGIPVIPTPPNQTMIIPFELAMDLGGYVGEIVVKFDKGITREKLVSYAQELSAFFDGKVFMSWGGDVYRVSRIRWFQALGWELVPAILIIGALNVATTILGNVKERTKDIFVFSSVGLSPLGASVLFLVESVTYAVIGTTIGYLSGLGFNALLIALNIVPVGHVFNYASIFVVIALVAVLVSALASSLYPSFVASRLITPSLERKWKPPTKPHHDEWTMDLPAVLTSIDEAYGLIEYLWEYYTGAGAAKPSFIVRAVSPPNFEELRLEIGTMSLAPYETHTDQRVMIQCFRAKGEKELYNLGVYLKMLSGNRSVWVSSNYYLIDDLRKQILIWRSLPQESREKLMRTAKVSLERAK